MDNGMRTMQRASVGGTHRGLKPAQKGRRWPSHGPPTARVLRPRRTRETSVRSVVTRAECKVAETLPTQKGWRRAYQVLTLVGVVPHPPGVEEVATGRFQLLRWNWGTPMPRDLPW